MNFKTSCYRRTRHADGSGGTATRFRRTATGPGCAADHGPRGGRMRNNSNYIVTGIGENLHYVLLNKLVQPMKNVIVGLFLSRVRPDFRCRDIVNI